MLKNDPISAECADTAYDNEVEFHPLDAIDIMPFEERVDLGDNSPMDR